MAPSRSTALRETRTHRSLPRVRARQVWHLLAWEGKHPQAPVSVASKPHYFCELAVGPSVRALLDAHPQFLESAELRCAAAQPARFT